MMMTWQVYWLIQAAPARHDHNSPVNLVVTTGLLIGYDDMQGACTVDGGHSPFYCYAAKWG